MYTINLNDNPHNFEKQNLVTEVGGFDRLTCSKCGIKGKTNSISTLSVKGSYSLDKILKCTFTDKEIRLKSKGRQIKIGFCTAQGKAFLNLTPDSIHEVIEAPKGEEIGLSGVWVMGNGEPVKVLNNEFDYVN